MPPSSVLHELAAPSRESVAHRHSALVRLTHWVTFVAFLALLLTGVEVLISHPRFYWGDTGNMNTPALFTLPIPSSRASVTTGYGYVLPDQNGWSRALHFQAAWALVLAGMLYLIFGLVSGHFRRNLVPSGDDRSLSSVAAAVVRHVRFPRASAAASDEYNTVQRVTYALVIFVLFPMMVWTGLAMSPAIEGAFPWAVVLLGGRQSARTLHFLITVTLVLFLLGHVVMVALAGFRTRVGAMITGRLRSPEERP